MFLNLFERYKTDDYYKRNPDEFENFILKFCSYLAVYYNNEFFGFLRIMDILNELSNSNSVFTKRGALSSNGTVVMNILL